MRPLRFSLVLLTLVPLASFAGAQESEHLYRTVMIRAAPGQLAELIERLDARMQSWRDDHEVGPFWMRHSQGDHWDLLLLLHHGSRLDAPTETTAAIERDLLPLIAWREELFVYGPPPTVVAESFDGAGFFHVEIFLALPGKREELLRQREMENVYLEGIGREPNLIFRRAMGAPWDAYTIGFYRDIQHFAESADVPAALEETAAVAAGFESASTIGTYLRELIGSHHDTLAVAIR